MAPPPGHDVPNGTSAAGAGSARPGTAITTRTGLAVRPGLAGATARDGAECEADESEAPAPGDAAGPVHAAVTQAQAQAPASTAPSRAARIIMPLGCRVTMTG
jgi:hypothetical protein